MNKITESREFKEYAEIKNKVRFLEVTLANIRSSGTPIACQHAMNDLEKAKKELVIKKQLLLNQAFTYLDSLC